MADQSDSQSIPTRDAWLGATSRKRTLRRRLSSIVNARSSCRGALIKQFAERGPISKFRLAVCEQCCHLFASAKGSEKFLNFPSQGDWLFHGREVPALFNFGPALNVGVGLLHDGTGGTDDFLTKRSVTDRNVNGAASNVFPQRRVQRQLGARVARSACLGGCHEPMRDARSQ